MSPNDSGSGGRDETKAAELRLALLNQAIVLVREALQAGRRSDAVRLYRGNDNDTKATAGALLSAWETFVQALGNIEEMLEKVTLSELAALLIRRACNRMRRADYHGGRIAAQVARAHACGTDGELLPFDPADPRQREEILKILPVLIAEVLGKRSKRDRLVIERWLEQFTYEEIVQCVRAALPGEPISIAMVSRIIARFKDEMRRCLEER